MADASYRQRLRDAAKCRHYENTVISQTEAIFRRPINIQRHLNDLFRIEFPLRPTPDQFMEFYRVTRERYEAISFMSVPGVLYDGRPVQIPVTAPSYIVCFLKSYSYAMSILLCSNCDVLLLTLYTVYFNRRKRLTTPLSYALTMDMLWSFLFKNQRIMLLG